MLEPRGYTTEQGGPFNCSDILRPDYGTFGEGFSYGIVEGGPVKDERRVVQHTQRMRTSVPVASLLEEFSIKLPQPEDEKNPNPEGASEMMATSRKKTGVTLQRSSPYPLPKGLLIRP